LRTVVAVETGSALPPVRPDELLFAKKQSLASVPDSVVENKPA
jgi:hypothetical protein